MVLMERMTSKEIGLRVAEGCRTVIVPLGSIEAHGDHLPIGTDSIVSSHLAERVAERVGNTLVAPVVQVGYAPRTKFPGTISVPVSTLLSVLMSYCEAMQRDGFKVVVLLPMHAESFQTLSLFAPELAAGYPGLVIVPSTDVATLLERRNRLAVEYGITPEEAGWHAGAAETSEMLAIDPSLVRMGDLRRGYLGPSGFGRPLPETLTAGWSVLDDRGVMGDASKSSAEFGERILDAIAQETALLIHSVKGSCGHATASAEGADAPVSGAAAP
jgi:creatinine amidohydrolase